MNRTIVISVAVMLVAIGMCVAGWDNIPVPQPAKDIIDLLIPVPANVVKEFGNTEKVRVVHDILMLKAEINRVLAARNARILTLEDSVKALEAKIEALTSGPTGLDLQVPSEPEKPDDATGVQNP